jgi:hypothetical protein
VPRQFPKRTRFFYDRFVDWANLSDPFGSDDIGRFYHFAWAAHEGRAKLDSFDVLRELVDDGFDVDDANRLADVYDTCRAFMRSRASIPSVGRDDWNSGGSTCAVPTPDAHPEVPSASPSAGR